jgi:hypothetical protein
MDDRLPSIRPEMDLHRVLAAQPLGNQRYSLGGKKMADEGRIQFSDRRRLEGREHVRCTKYLEQGYGSFRQYLRPGREDTPRRTSPGAFVAAKALSWPRPRQYKCAFSAQAAEEHGRLHSSEPITALRRRSSPPLIMLCHPLEDNLDLWSLLA